MKLLPIVYGTVIFGTLVILVGCLSNEQIINPNQPAKEIKFENMKTANCDELSDSYVICRKHSITNYNRIDCNTMYMPLIAERCK